MKFGFSWPSGFREESEHTHILTLGAFGIRLTVHVLVFLHTKTQQLRAVLDKTNIGEWLEFLHACVYTYWPANTNHAILIKY